MSSAPRVVYALADAGKVPADDSWLGERELERQQKMKVAKRRGDFRLGRFVAKRLLQSLCPATPPSRLEIVADDEGAPRGYEGEERLPVSLSLSHRGDHGFAVITEGERALGCDLELVEARSEAFLRDYFTEDERAHFAAQAHLARTILANLLWSAKESALKALRTGLRRDARELEVGLSDYEEIEGRWLPLRVLDLEEHHEFHGYWQRRGQLLLTVVMAERMEPPGPLLLPARATEAGL